jgi:hypothetical protein
MTDTRPGAEFFGRPSQQQKTPAPETNMPRFGPPSKQAPRSAPQPSTPPPGMAVSGSTAPAGGTHAPPAQPPQGVMARAKADDPRALETLFEQFVPAAEQIVETRYLGVLGLWGIGTHSFAAVTTHRVASLRVGILGAVSYQDGSLEYMNSSAIFQPSRLEMYWPAVLWVLLFVGGAVTFGLSPVMTLASLLIALLFVPVIVRLQYRFKKSGLVIWVREGLSIYVFIDRKRIALANRFYRLCAELREERIREVGHP